MAENLGKATLELATDKSNLTKGLSDSEKDVKGWGSRVGDVAKTAVLGLSAVGVGIAVAGIKAAADAERIAAQTDAVLRSTKGAAGVTREAVDELSASLSRVTPFEDDVIQKTQNMLLTFTSIGKDVFPLATETALDMATALGGDSTQAAIQLGKALNDPIRGVGALRKVGVSFTEAQMKQIETLQNSGQLMEAQKIILKELAVEFGGSARAAGETFAGKLEIAKTQLGNVFEIIGGALIPTLGNLLTAVTPIIEAFGAALPQVFAALGEMFGVITGEAPFAGAALKDLLGEEVATTIMGTLAAIREGFKVLSSVLSTAVEFIKTNVFPPLMQAVEFFKQNWDATVIAVKAMALMVLVPAFVAWAAAAGAAAVATIAALLPVLVPVAAVGAAVFLLYTAWNSNFGGIRDITAGIFSFLSSTFQNIVAAVRALWEGASAWWTQFTENPPRMIGQMVGFIIGFFITLPSKLAGALGQVLKTVAGWIGDMLGSFQGWTKSNDKVIGDFLGSLPSRFFDAAVAAVRGLINGFGSMVGAVWNAVTSFFSGIVDGVKEALGIKSPSKVFAEIGANMAKGVGVGIEANTAGVHGAVADLLRVPASSYSATGASLGSASFGSGGSDHGHDIYLDGDLVGRLLGRRTVRGAALAGGSIG